MVTGFYSIFLQLIHFFLFLLSQHYGISITESYFLTLQFCSEIIRRSFSENSNLSIPLVFVYSGKVICSFFGLDTYQLQRQNNFFFYCSFRLFCLFFIPCVATKVRYFLFCLFFFFCYQYRVFPNWHRHWECSTSNYADRHRPGVSLGMQKPYNHFVRSCRWPHVEFLTKFHAPRHRY